MANKRRNKKQFQKPKGLVEKYDCVNYVYWAQDPGGHKSKGRMKQVFSQRLRNKLKQETKKEIEDGDL